MITENKVVPKLRFREFNDYWNNYLLGNIAEFLKGKGISKSELDDDGKTECIRYGELYVYYNELIDEVKSKTNLENTVLSKANDVIIPASGETQLDIATCSCVLRSGIALGGDLNIIRTKNNGLFLSYYLNSKKKFDIARLSQGSSVVHIYASQLKKLNLNLPSLIEQKKVASFLSAVDEKLKQLTKKKELLEDYKKGIMQKIFSQEIRFKDDNGNNYPNWEEGKLNELVSTPISDGPHLTPKFIEDGVPFLSVNNIVDNKIDFKNVRTISYENHLEFSKKCKPIKNDLLLGKAASVGKIAIVETDIEFNVWSPLAMIRIKEIYESKYFYFCFQTQTLQKRIKNFINSSSQGNIGMGDIGKLIFEFPKSKEEQKKITTLLSSIDKKIESVNHQLEKTKEFKKGLLQQMFV